MGKTRELFRRFKFLHRSQSRQGQTTHSTSREATVPISSVSGNTPPIATNVEQHATDEAAIASSTPETSAPQTQSTQPSTRGPTIPSSSLSRNTPSIARHPEQQAVASELAINPLAPVTAARLDDARSSEIPSPAQQLVHLNQTSTPQLAGRGNDKYGLFPMNLGAQGLTTTERSTSNSEAYPVDIIAVHGITGDAYGTWTHGNKKLWLRDFLNDDLPGARIFSYGYDAGVFFSLSTGGYEEFAETLLGHVKQTRSNEANRARRLIFICHSMGGIIVKEAIITALLKGVMYENIRQSCLGIVFLGTPHQGSTVLGFPKLLAAIANVATLGTGTSRLFGRARTDLLTNLEREAPILDSIGNKFVEQTRSIKIATFVEMNRTRPSNDRIVDRHSAVMKVPGEQIYDMQGCDHVSMCRFEERNNNYRLVCGVLKDWWAEVAPQNPAEQEQLRIAESITSLRFPEMHDRESDLEVEAQPGTCGWIFDNSRYVAWLNDSEGVLWIKGKPGAGKSTILKTLVNHFERQKSDRFIVLKFFFHAFGDPRKHLKNSAAGMYRVLLIQLCEQVPSAAFRFQLRYEKREPGRRRSGRNIEWRDEDQNQIRKLLNDELEALDAAFITVRIFVDAIDEAFQGKAPEIGRYLFDLDAKLRGLGKDVRVCISSRHFPIAPVPERYTIVLEEENSKDIRAFVDEEFELLHTTPRDILESDGTLLSLKEQIVDKSAGIFLWVSLVVRVVIDRLNKGDPFQKVITRLDDAPPRLGQIYTDMISKVIQPEDREDAYSLLTWAVKTEEPLFLTKLSSEVKFTWPFFISPYDPQHQKNKTLQRLGLSVGSYSGGLMEARCYDLQNQHTYVALFIHQTVRTFLQERGLRALREQLPLALSTDSSDNDRSDEEDDRSDNIERKGKLSPASARSSQTSGTGSLSGGSSRSGRLQNFHPSILHAPLDRKPVIELSPVREETHHVTSPKTQQTSDSELWAKRNVRSQMDMYEPFTDSSKPADQWFENLEMETLPLLEPPSKTNRVRIAVFDTGLDGSHPFLQGESAKRVLGSWPVRQLHDEQGHGTHTAGLILKVAPTAELYVAQVIRGTAAERGIVDPVCVVEAIQRAVRVWKVDIISMSFGFKSAHPEIMDAILDASKAGVLIFAPSSNGKLSTESLNFPAQLPEVIAISSADGYGNISSFNPPLVPGHDNFAVLGEGLESWWPPALGQGPTARKSGTSFATPIAAAIAANILQYARQILPSNSLELAAVTSQVGMRQLFSYMSSSREGHGSRQSYGYIVPWKLLSNSSSPDENANKIRRILRDNLPHSLREADGGRFAGNVSALNRLMDIDAD